MKKIIFAACLLATPAQAAFYGTYHNPIQDPLAGDLSAPVHRGMYCVGGTWHYGWLRYWEHSPVVKPSCGTAVYQLTAQHSYIPAQEEPAPMIVERPAPTIVVPAPRNCHTVRTTKHDDILDTNDWEEHEVCDE
jgi:hypothetical protein